MGSRVTCGRHRAGCGGPAHFFAALVLIASVLVGPVNPVPATAQPVAQQFSVLVFSKTAGFRHDSIPAGIAAIQQLGADNGFTVVATEDAGAFNDANLARFA